eukprot:m.8942 g.8942  ORF g.8942 m.8942 type:complete len:1223 (-) comp2349_c0_seq1:153-3821(-)
MSEKDIAGLRISSPPLLGSRGGSFHGAGERTISVIKDPQGFGFSLRGSCPVYILAVAADGPADRAGLKAGDQIITINSADMTDKTHETVVSTIKQSGQVLMMRVRSGALPSTEEDRSSLSSSPQKPSSRSMSAMIHAYGDGDDDPESSISFREPVAPLQEDEKAAFAPFADFEAMLRRCAHTATFIHYLMSIGKHEEEMMLLLHIGWFASRPNREEALAIFEDFMATNAPLKIEAITPVVFQEIESALNDKALDPQRFNILFGRARQCLLEPLSAALGQFRELITTRGQASLYRATMLVDLVSAEEPSVVEELIRPLVDVAQRDAGDPSPRGDIIMSTLLQFLHRAGVNVDKYLLQDPKRAESLGAPPEHNFRLRRGDSKDGSFFKKSKKVHLHMGHHFVTMSYPQPTFCGVCKALLWGVMRQGWNCVDCGFNVHKSTDLTGHRKCHELIDVPCPGHKVDKKGVPKKPRVRPGYSMRDDDKPIKTPQRSDSMIEARRVSEEPSVPEEPAALRPPDVTVTPGSPVLRRRSQSGSAALFASGELPAPPIVSPPPPPPTPPVKLPDDPALESTYWCEIASAKALAKKMSKSDIKRQEGIYELIQTEKSYIRSLAILHHYFRVPIRDEGLLTPDQIHTLFANLTELAEMNVAFCKTLCQLQSPTDPVVASIGPVFLDGFNKLDPNAFALFCSNQTTASAFYREKRRTYPPFNTRITSLEAQPICDRLSLLDFIVKPLQRLTKYPLLLKDILKNTDKSDKAEIEALTQALASTEAVLRHVQEMVKESEDRARLKEIHDKLDRSALDVVEEASVRDLHLGRKLIIEGPLQIRMQDKHIDVHAVLLTDLLLLTQPKDGKLILKAQGKDAKKQSAVIHIATVMVRPVAVDSKAFYLIVSPPRGRGGPQMFDLVTVSRSSMKDWMDKIAKTAEDFKRNNPTWEDKRNEISDTISVTPSELTMDRPDEQDPLDITIGQIIEQMRDNTDTNGRLLHRIMELLGGDGHDSDSTTRSTRDRFNRRAYRRTSSRLKADPNSKFRRSNSMDERGGLVKPEIVQQPSSPTLAPPALSERPSASSLQRESSFRRSDDEGGDHEDGGLEWTSQQLATALHTLAALQTENAELRVHVSELKRKLGGEPDADDSMRVDDHPPSPGGSAARLSPVLSQPGQGDHSGNSSPANRRVAFRSHSPRRIASSASARPSMRPEDDVAALLRRHDGIVDMDFESQESFI